MSISGNLQGRTGWRSPSNIALVKYWGKYGIQLPRNASVSLTLDEAFSETIIDYRPKQEKDPGISVTFTFDGQPNVSFENKIRKFLTGLTKQFSFLEELHLDIQSRNSFPHSAGIASSASSMSALALCLCGIEQEIKGDPGVAAFYEKASLIARLGSGSACRSVYPFVAVWGQHPGVPSSSNEYAVPVAEEVDPVFKTMKDSILIVSSAEKSVSSRAGHALMEGNSYAPARYQQANQHLSEILSAMKAGDLEKWGAIVEKEALTLHALMMASEPPYILMRADTLAVIEKIHQLRNEQKVPVYFTLDAGPNVHVLYPDSVKDIVISYINKELVSLCENGRVIHDQVGQGPVKIV